MLKTHRTPAAGDWFGDPLKTVPHRLVTTGSEQAMRQIFDDFKQTSRQINDAHIPYWLNPDLPNAANSNSADATFLRQSALPVGKSRWSDKSHFFAWLLSQYPSICCQLLLRLVLMSVGGFPQVLTERWNAASAKTDSVRSARSDLIDAADSRNIQFDPTPISRSRKYNLYGPSNLDGALSSNAEAVRSVTFDPTPLSANPPLDFASVRRSSSQPTP